MDGWIIHKQPITSTGFHRGFCTLPVRQHAHPYLCSHVVFVSTQDQISASAKLIMVNLSVRFLIDLFESCWGSGFPAAHLLINKMEKQTCRGDRRHNMVEN